MATDDLGSWGALQEPYYPGEDELARNRAARDAFRRRQESLARIEREAQERISAMQATRPADPPRWWQGLGDFLRDAVFRWEVGFVALVVMCLGGLVFAIGHEQDIERYCAQRQAVRVDIKSIHYCAPLSSLHILPDSIQ